MRAAVTAGADAVYLGLEEFNARRSAENFTIETLAEAVRFAHLRGIRVYLTANVVVLPDEMDAVLAMIDNAWVQGIDAVIVQDLGLLRLLRRLLPSVRVHASTQINAHSTASVLALADLGVSRVTLSREVSLSEIERFSAEALKHSVEVESFVHGALCMCYSGQCLMSSLIGGRSANRGQCAQPCRLPYELIDETGRDVSEVAAHLLSPKDLAAISVLPQLVETGVSALKLEGRMKSAEYVALVTGIYRAALDRAAGASAYEVRDGELAVLSEAFTRGFTEAYLLGDRGNDMMSYSRPNNRGVLVGRVSSTSAAGSSSVDLSTAVDAEDTIEVWTSRGRFAQELGDLEVASAHQRFAPAGARVGVRFSEPVSQGDRVFRVRNAALSDAARRLYQDRHGAPIPLSFGVKVAIGSPLEVEVVDGSGRRGLAQGASVEAARTKPVTAADISEHVGRLGGTPFSATGWDIELSPGAGVSFSSLHEVRRRALEDYQSRLLAPWGDRASLRPVAPVAPKRRKTAAAPRLVAVAGTLEAASECLRAGADEVHVAGWLLGGEGALPEGVIPVAPRVLHDHEMEAMHIPALGLGRGVAGTLGSIRELGGAGVRLQSHWSLNAVNPHTVAALSDLGCELVWLSPELSLEQVERIIAESVVDIGVGVSGRQEIMVTEHCVLMSEGACSRRCGTCTRRAGTRFLKDRKGYRFPVVTDPVGRSHIYNSVPLDVTHALDRLVRAGVAAVRVDAEVETPAEAAAMVRAARQALQRALAGERPDKKAGQTTSGHFFRGLS